MTLAVDKNCFNSISRYHKKTVVSLGTKLTYVSRITCSSHYSSLEKNSFTALLLHCSELCIFIPEKEGKKIYHESMCTSFIWVFLLYVMLLQHNHDESVRSFPFSAVWVSLPHPVCVWKTGKSYSRILLNSTLHQHNWFFSPLAFKINFNRLVHWTVRIPDKNRLMCSEQRPEEEELNKKIKWREKYSGT